MPSFENFKMPGEAQFRDSLHCVSEGGEKNLLWCSFTFLLRTLFQAPAGAMAFAGIPALPGYVCCSRACGRPNQGLSQDEVEQ